MKKILIAGWMVVPLMAAAQPASLPVPAKRVDLPLAYRSAFAGYKVFKDSPVGAWPELNDAVARAGGWRAYAREAGGSKDGPADDASPSASRRSDE